MVEKLEKMSEEDKKKLYEFLKKIESGVKPADAGYILGFSEKDIKSLTRAVKALGFVDKDGNITEEGKRFLMEMESGEKVEIEKLEEEIPGLEEKAKEVVEKEAKTIAVTKEAETIEKADEMDVMIAVGEIEVSGVEPLVYRFTDSRGQERKILSLAGWREALRIFAEQGKYRVEFGEPKIEINPLYKLKKESEELGISLKLDERKVSPYIAKVPLTLYRGDRAIMTVWGVASRITSDRFIVEQLVAKAIRNAIKQVVPKIIHDMVIKEAEEKKRVMDLSEPTTFA